MRFLLALFLFQLTLPVLADMVLTVEIDRAFARAAIQQQRNSAIFMHVLNKGDSTRIVAARSPVADIVELHTHINDSGVMRMRKINQIELPAGEIVKLEPGGLHIMLLGLNRDLVSGEQIEATLVFADGNEQLLRVPVKKVNTMKHGEANHMRKPQMIRH